MSVINLDCRMGLKLFPGQFDAAIVDPPYGDTSLDWDKQVDGWIAALADALKPNASIWIFGSMRFLAPVFAQMAEHGFKYSQDIVWEKQNGTGFHNDRFRRVHEHAVLFYRGAWGDVYHEAQHTFDATARTTRRGGQPAHTGAIADGVYTSVEGGPRLMRSVLQIRNENGRAVHPTQKPVEILRPLVRYSVPPGGRLCDPFAGSGSAGVACALEGRAYIGFETDVGHAGRAAARVAAGVA